MKPFKIALVGYGFGGRIFHAPFIAKMSPTFFELDTILTSNPKNVELAKTQFPTATIVSKIEQVLNNEAIDIVVIATPNQLHYPYAKQALESGKHVVVEKPFTISTSEANELIDLAKSKDKVITINHNRRWDSDFKTVKKVIEAGYLGKLVEYEAHFDRFRNYIKPNAWKEDTELGAGILYDLGSHLIDQALLLFGKPQALFADLRAQRKNSSVTDSFELILYYENLKVTLKASMLVRIDLPKYKLFGRNGTFINYGPDRQEADLIAGKNPEESTWGIEEQSKWGTIHTTYNGEEMTGQIQSEAGSYDQFYSNLYQVLQGEAELAVKAEQARDVVSIIELALKSQEKRKVLEVTF